MMGERHDKMKRIDTKRLWQFAKLLQIGDLDWVFSPRVTRPSKKGKGEPIAMVLRLLPTAFHTDWYLGPDNWPRLKDSENLPMDVAVMSYFNLNQLMFRHLFCYLSQSSLYPGITLTTDADVEDVGYNIVCFVRAIRFDRRPYENSN